MNKSSYSNNLIKAVLDRSISSNWQIAVKEWDIVDCQEDSSQSRSCVCGKENLVYLFTIVNRYTGCQLFPIGSTCIKKFDRDELNEEAHIRESMFKLYHAVSSRKFITLSTEFFSRKIINRLYDDGAFNTAYNGYNGKSDHDFILKMFNKRDKSKITQPQRRKINAIIVASILPYLRRNLASKSNIK